MALIIMWICYMPPINKDGAIAQIKATKAAMKLIRDNHA